LSFDGGIGFVAMAGPFAIYRRAALERFLLIGEPAAPFTPLRGAASLPSFHSLPVT